MKYLKRIDERLIISDSFYNVLSHLQEEYKDVVAHFLLYLFQESELYDDDNDVNFIEVSKQVKMLTFRPLNRRSKNFSLNFVEEKSTAMRMGRLVKAIVRQVDKYLNVSKEVEAVIYRIENGNRTYLLIDDRITFMRNNSFGFEPQPTLWITVDGKKFEMETKTIALRVSDIFGDIVTEIQFENQKGLPVDIVQVGKLLPRFVTRKKIKIELKSNFELTDKNIEKFVERTVGYIKSIRSDSDCEFKLVNGEQIRNWYSIHNYQAIQGELGASCMAEEHAQDYLNIYCENTDQVSLLILLNKDKKLLGRALVWKLTDGRFFMDRCYTIMSTDKYVFFDYAKEQGWIYKFNELGEYSFRYLDTSTNISDMTIKVKLDYWQFDSYPYLDTLSILDLDTGTLTNLLPSNGRLNHVRLNSTGGGYIRCWAPPRA